MQIRLKCLIFLAGFSVFLTRDVSGQGRDMELISVGSVMFQLDGIGPAQVRFEIWNADVTNNDALDAAQAMQCDTNSVSFHSGAASRRVSFRCPSLLGENHREAALDPILNRLVTFLRDRFYLRAIVAAVDFNRFPNLIIDAPDWHEQFYVGQKYLYFQVEQGPLPRIGMQFGYGPGDFQLVPPILLGFLFGPCLSVMLVASMKRDSAGDTRMAVWVALTWLGTATWFIWLSIQPLFNFPAAAEYMLRGHPHWAAIAGAAAFAIPAVTAQVLLTGASIQSLDPGHEVTSFWVKLGRSAQSNLESILPLALVLSAVRSARNDTVLAGVLLVVAYGAPKLLRAIWGRRQNEACFRLADHPLKDHALALARKAGVELNEVLIRRESNDELGNAFALKNGSVMISESLLNLLSKKEVDAVIGHELAHLQQRSWSGKPLVWIGSVVCSFLLRWVPVRSLGTSLVVLPLAPAIAVLFSTFQARRNERLADEGGVRINGDARSAITSLVKLTRMHGMPLKHGALAGALFTHPAGARRLRWIAAEGHLPEGEIQRLLEHLDDDPERYEIQFSSGASKTAQAGG